MTGANKLVHLGGETYVDPNQVVAVVGTPLGKPVGDVPVFSGPACRGVVVLANEAMLPIYYDPRVCRRRIEQARDE